MSALFTPIKLRGLNLANRIMVAPMCQYSSVDGEANDWHFTHINSLALSGAAIFCIEATAVEASGRITPGALRGRLLGRPGHRIDPGSPDPGTGDGLARGRGFRSGGCRSG